MLHKGTPRQLFDACTEPYDFLLITLKPDGRSMVRINGHRAVRNLTDVGTNPGFRFWRQFRERFGANLGFKVLK